VRRLLVPSVLLAALVSGAALAAWPPSAEAGAPGTAGSSPSTPVLSPRRVPALLARTVGAARLEADLAAVAAGVPDACLVVAPAVRGAAPLFAWEPGASLVPASNLKLLTALAALDVLGPTHRFTTEVRARVGAGGRVDGDLWLVGGGDPLLATADYVATLERQPQPFTDLAELARRVRAAGVTEVRGRVVGDESRYDTERYVPTWKPSYRTRNEIGPMSALTVNDNFTAWRPVRIAAERPATAAAAVFSGLLRATGVAVGGEPGEGTAPPDAPVVAAVASPTVAEVVGQMLRESDNLTAELLVKEMGRERAGTGTTVAGARVVTESLAARGIPTAGVVVRDGSGLDRGDRATCEALIGVLTAAGPASPVAAGLAVANRTGTLAKRFGGNPAAGRLRAKTGTLDGVAALSGFVDAADGTTLAFAFVANGLTDGGAGLRAWERLGAVLAGYPAAPPVAELGPR
jgi:D-alanyl-D-alanine carboxypeptidase/D-alanyl-D-alanine-endopeptidase (penicillin-binding protein 4)